jgi:hypothetical protein
MNDAGLEMQRKVNTSFHYNTGQNHKITVSNKCSGNVPNVKVFGNGNKKSKFY